MPSLLKVGEKHINIDRVIKVGEPYKTRKDEDCVKIVISGSEDITLVGEEALEFLTWLGANAVNAAKFDKPKPTDSPTVPFVQTKAAEPKPATKR